MPEIYNPRVCYRCGAWAPTHVQRLPFKVPLAHNYKSQMVYVYELGCIICGARWYSDGKLPGLPGEADKKSIAHRPFLNRSRQKT